MKTHDPAIVGAYFRLLELLKKQHWTALIAGVLVLGLLSFLSLGALIEIHWLTFIVFSTVSGCWFMGLGRLVLWLHFLWLHSKSRNRTPQILKYPPSSQVLKKTKQALFIFCGMTSLLAFNLFIVITQQFHTHSPVYFFSWSNLFMQMYFSLFLSIAPFVIVNFIASALHVKLFNRSPRYPSSNSLEYLSEYTPLTHHTKFSENEPDFAKRMRESWNHDPINPASSEYQSTYRRWFHHD